MQIHFTTNSIHSSPHHHPLILTCHHLQTKMCQGNQCSSMVLATQRNRCLWTIDLVMRLLGGQQAWFVLSKCDYCIPMIQQFRFQPRRGKSFWVSLLGLVGSFWIVEDIFANDWSCFPPFFTMSMCHVAPKVCKILGHSAHEPPPELQRVRVNMYYELLSSEKEERRGDAAPHPSVECYNQNQRQGKHKLYIGEFCWTNK